MMDRIRAVKFAHFRGLPDTEFTLKGRNLVLLGSNGTGKSALVDGIEFVFSGQVGRFVGSGTGNIKHDDAVQHIYRKGAPRVTLHLYQSNGSIARTLGSSAVAMTNRAGESAYFRQHQGVNSFILRRSKILEFVCDQDADRYQKFVQLLGLSSIDNLQRSFVEAEKQATEKLHRLGADLQMRLAAFNDHLTHFSPKTLGEILLRASESVKANGLGGLSSWAEANACLPLLKAMRPHSNSTALDEFTRALVSLETPLPSNNAQAAGATLLLREKLTQLASASAEAAKGGVLAEATRYLEKYPEPECPLCERQFDMPAISVLERLRVRVENLREIREAEANHCAIRQRMQQFLDGIAVQIASDLRHSKLLAPDTIRMLRLARAVALRRSRRLRRSDPNGHNFDASAAEGFSDVLRAREACAFALRKRKADLIPPDTSQLEAAITLLERGVASEAKVNEIHGEIVLATELSRRAGVAKEALSKARERAVQSIFNQIAGTVLSFYRQLHECGGAERSECTAIELKPTSRAAAGGVRLAINFLGLADPSDPRAFLSEGHLDSLGLCIFLAVVRTFNPPGSLLVLDDVLTSIDRDHRRRVGELLFQQFSDYQILLTTHDEYWRDLLSTSAQAWGTQDQWVFVKLATWGVGTGPSFSEIDDSWGYIDSHLNESDYRELGGPFRVVLEDFLKRTCAKMVHKVGYKYDEKYTAGDFVAAGLHDAIRQALIKALPVEETLIRTSVGRVFGQGDLVNFLSHDNPGRLEITFDQAVDFVGGLRDLTKRCESAKLIRGRS